MSQLVPVMFAFHTLCITASSHILCVYECMHTYCFVRPTYTYGVSVIFCLRGNAIHNLDYAGPSDAFVRTLASYDEVPVLDPNRRPDILTSILWFPQSLQEMSVWYVE